MSAETRSKPLRRRKRIIPGEPVEFERISITIPKDLLKEIDYATKLYRQTRSGLIQIACNEIVKDTARADWIREILQEKDVRKGETSYNVDKLISRLFEETAEIGENSFQLSPPQMEFLRGELEKAKGESRKSSWSEFCEKCKCDPEKIVSDKPTILVPPEELVG